MNLLNQDKINKIKNHIIHLSAPKITLYISLFLVGSAVVFFASKEAYYQFQMYQGSSHLKKQQWSQALESYTSASDIHNKSTPALEGIADALFGQEKWRDSTTFYEKILNSDISSTEYLLKIKKKISLAYFRNEQYEHASEVLKSIEPNVLEKDTKLKAIFDTSSLRKSAREQPVFKILPYYKRYSTQEIQKKEQIIHDIEKKQIALAKVDSEISGALLPLALYVSHAKARLYRLKKNFPESLEEYNKILKHQPGEEGYIFERANLYYENGKEKEALSELEKALKVDAGHYPSLYLLGEAHNKSNRFQLARKYFTEFDTKYSAASDKTSEYLPENAYFESFKKTGYLIMKHTQRPKEAIRYFQKALRVKFDQPLFLQTKKLVTQDIKEDLDFLSADYLEISETEKKDCDGEDCTEISIHYNVAKKIFGPNFKKICDVNMMLCSIAARYTAKVNNNAEIISETITAPSLGIYRITENQMDSMLSRLIPGWPTEELEPEQLKSKYYSGEIGNRLRGMISQSLRV